MGLFNDLGDALAMQQNNNSGGGGGAPPAQPTAGLMVDPNSNAPETPRTGVAGYFQKLLPQPAGYRGLLSDEDMAHARRMALLTGSLSMLGSSSAVSPDQPAPGIGAALAKAAGTGLNSFDQSMGGDLQARQAGLQARQGENILRVRQAVQAKFPPVPGETQQEMLERTGNMAAALAANGDYEGAKAMSEAEAPLRMSRAYSAMGAGGRVIQTAQGFYMIGPDGTPKPLTDAQGQALTGTGPTEADRAAGRTAAATNAATRADASAQHQAVAEYDKAITPYSARAAMLRSSRSGLEGLMSTDPGVRIAAQKQIPGIQASLEPMKPQLRAQLVDYYSNVDKSIPGKIMAAIDNGTISQLPPDQIRSLYRFVNMSARNSKADVTREYKAATKYQPNAPFRTPDTIFGPDSDWQDLPGGPTATGVTSPAATGVAPTAPAAAAPKNGVDIRSLIR